MIKNVRSPKKKVFKCDNDFNESNIKEGKIVLKTLKC